MCELPHASFKQPKSVPACGSKPHFKRLVARRHGRSGTLHALTELARLDSIIGSRRVILLPACILTLRSPVLPHDFQYYPMALQAHASGRAANRLKAQIWCEWQMRCRSATQPKPQCCWRLLKRLNIGAGLHLGRSVSGGGASHNHAHSDAQQCRIYHRVHCWQPRLQAAEFARRKKCGAGRHERAGDKYVAVMSRVARREAEIHSWASRGPSRWLAKPTH
eukprot:SAG31_NODE_129_length_23447_cov_5.010922_6_plen_221_part_00